MTERLFGPPLIAAAVLIAFAHGANDVANNVGPAVGSKALTLGSALILAAIFEAAGALIAGGEVVGTIRSGGWWPRETSFPWPRKPD